MDAAERITRDNTRLALTIAASYGGRQDIAAAARAPGARTSPPGACRHPDIDEGLFASRVALADLPPPDLFIRTGGDFRISNFLLWQLAYTELWFTETLWPDAGCRHTAPRPGRLRQPRAPLRPDRSAAATPGRPSLRRDNRMTKTRVLAALVLTPLAIAAMLFLPTPWLVALAAVMFLAGLWEWFRLADVDDTLARTVLLVANLALMVAIVWGSRLPAADCRFVLFQLGTVIGVIWWLLAVLWLKHFDFASDHDTHARVFKLAAGTLAIVPAWCALAWIHAERPMGHRWLFVALALVWAADTGAYFVGRHFGKRKLSPRISPNKTVEGLLGGLGSGVIVAVAFAPLAGASRRAVAAGGAGSRSWRWHSRWSATCSRACSSAMSVPRIRAT